MCQKAGQQINKSTPRCSSCVSSSTKNYSVTAAGVWTSVVRLTLCSRRRQKTKMDSRKGHFQVVPECRFGWKRLWKDAWSRFRVVAQCQIRVRAKVRVRVKVRGLRLGLDLGLEAEGGVAAPLSIYLYETCDVYIVILELSLLWLSLFSLYSLRCIMLRFVIKYKIYILLVHWCFTLRFRNQRCSALSERCWHVTGLKGRSHIRCACALLRRAARGVNARNQNTRSYYFSRSNE